MPPARGPKATGIASPAKSSDRRARVGLVVAIAAATFIVTLSTASLAVAVPSIARDLGSTTFASSLIVVTPQLVGTVLLLPCGRASDLFGRRRCYVAALMLFTAASLVMVFVPDVWSLIALEVVQAAAVAAVWANSAALLYESLDERSFRHALGYYIAAISVADLVGPTIGGLITGVLGWRWIFAVLAAAAVGSLVWAVAALPRADVPTRVGTFDLLGTGLLVVGLAAVVAGLLIIESSGRIDATGVVCLVAGLVIVCGCLRVESRRHYPLVDLRLFRGVRQRLAVSSSALNAAAQWVPSLLLVLYFQAYDGRSAAVAGLLTMPLPIASALSSMAMGRLSGVTRSEVLATTGSFIALAGLAGIAASIGSSYAALMVFLILLGVGGGIFSTAVADVLIRETTLRDTGAVNGMRLTAQNLGWVVGTCVALGVATSRLAAHARRAYFAGTVHAVSARTAHLLLTGYHLAFLVLAVLAACASVLVLALQRVHSRGVRER